MPKLCARLGLCAAVVSLLAIGAMFLACRRGLVSPVFLSLMALFYAAFAGLVFVLPLA